MHERAWQAEAGQMFFAGQWPSLGCTGRVLTGTRNPSSKLAAEAVPHGKICGTNVMFSVQRAQAIDSVKYVKGRENHTPCKVSPRGMVARVMHLPNLGSRSYCKGESAGRGLGMLGNTYFASLETLRAPLKLDAVHVRVLLRDIW